MDVMTEPSGAHIVVVDDDPNVREILAEGLRDAGYQVTTAENACGALAAMASQPPPGVLISDIDLGPGPTGIDLAHTAESLLPGLPVVLISGHWITDPNKPIPASATFLHKPIRLAPLLTLLAQLAPAPVR
jgi:DNA-binding NtrC family response regulator